ncbi:hypothetical protein [Paraburkholderia sp. J12]|uniref:hypothetical protein n=1 Tax=Paraburkholderia sp. J12 TaxID=2805432 RepID=UPI002ABE41B3|nr:hypothetical protein [Paraburkholderia sp. J12]
MKTWLKAYRHYLKKAARTLPVCLFMWEGWRDMLDEVRALLGSILCILFCLFVTLTFPVSVFLVAACACESDRRYAKRRAAYLREMSRGSCVDWSEDE